VERRRPTPLPPGTFDDSVEAAGHLVRVEGVRVLVDGYNVTKSARPELALSEQRRWLTDAAVELAARTGARVELVFDGADERPSAPANLGRRQGVQVRFSAEGVEADDLLLELIEGLPRHVPVVVASDDRRVRDGAERRGANVVSTAQLLTVLGRPPS
jgi:predicted RNA-binding protein with PIN domain